ncbi:thyroid transcription factor 1-associated protein 26-like [Eurosta solidaginis]|uniref:thyroid transcription factor 1-associated protein 26-like n=1 Tax=Eurosta solidaginis TaxID=178769 RepID=UPI0035310136
MGNLKVNAANRKTAGGNNKEKAPYAQRKPQYKSQQSGKMQWRKRKPQNELRKQKLKEREDLRTRKIAEAKAEKERAHQEKQERIKSYKKKRLERTKAISKKTQRGQPLMKDRMQLLLKQIQEMKRYG